MEAIAVGQESQRLLDDHSGYVERERWTREQVRNYQARALRACRDYAYSLSPFYQRFHRGLMDRPLHELPVLTKSMMMENFDNLITDPAVRLHDVQRYLALADASKLFLDRYQVMVTSGTTGTPGLFLTDRAEGTIIFNTYTRFEVWGGVTTKSRAAVVASKVPSQMSSQFPIFIDGQRVERIHLSASDPLDEVVRDLNEYQPDTLCWYSSIGSILANEQLKGRLRIKPRSIFCAAETLTSEMRRRIEEAWQTKLFNVYATTEGGILATECSAHQGLHLFEDFSIVEVVDQDNRPVPPGVQGEKVLITALFRRTQPLIRYELTDLVRPSTAERCACGSPFALLESIEGRTPEVLYLPSPKGEQEGVYPYVFHNSLDALPVSGWQVIHEQDGLHIYLTGAEEHLRDERVHESLRQALTNRGVLVPPITIHRVAVLNKTARGKTPMVISRVPRPVQ